MTRYDLGRHTLRVRILLVLAIAGSLYASAFFAHRAPQPLPAARTAAHHSLL